MPHEVDGPHVGKRVVNLYGEQGTVIDDLATQYWVLFDDNTYGMVFKKESKLIK